MDDKLTALAEACERAAEGYERQIFTARPMRARWLEEQARLFGAHARAIREGRVTVNEGGDA